jgi:hypothetical protein
MSETERAPGRRTFKVSAGKLVKDIYEQEIVGACEGLGLTCEITEHPHLLTTEIAFAVSGEEDSMDLFEDFATREARWTLERVSGIAS